jgi:hypothetical protein
MERAYASGVLSPVLSPKKAGARAALVNLKDSPRSLLAECFRQFTIDTVPMGTDAPERLAKEKFEACVLSLGPHAQPVMEAARNSPSNSRMVIYGLGGSAAEAMRFSRFGINAVFNEPLERPAALKLVRATHSLVMHEFRRYVRVPIVTEVSITTVDNQRLTATSVEISSGGMSMTCPQDLRHGANVEISFALLTLPRIWVRGTVTWRNAAAPVLGVRFDPADDRRLRVKEWVDAYLES